MNEQLSEYERRYEAVDALDEPSRSRLLAEIMSDMEFEFKIPVQQSEVFDRANPAVMALYRKVSYARDL